MCVFFRSFLVATNALFIKSDLDGKQKNMPSYQLCLILKSALSRTELHHALRRSCETILERQGIIRSLENMGHKPLPNRIRKYGEHHLKGRYFLVNYESSAGIQSDIKEYLHRDIDVLAPNIILRKEEETYSPEFTPCIFGELPNPEHEKYLWRSKILRHLKISRKYKIEARRSRPS